MYYIGNSKQQSLIRVMEPGLGGKGFLEATHKALMVVVKSLDHGCTYEKKS